MSEMIYRRGDYAISISKVDGFGKRPSLWVHNKNIVIKVASFGSEEKARMFWKYLDFFLLVNAEPPEEESE